MPGFKASRACLVAQLVKNSPTMWETWVRSLGWEDPPEKGRAAPSSVLAWRELSSVAQSCQTICDPLDCSTQGLPVHHQLLELAQTHVHRIGDAIQSSHPLSSPSPPAFHLAQHQGLSKWVSSSHWVAKVLELQHQSFQRIFRTDFLLDLLVWSPCSPRDSQESSPTPQFKSINSLVLRFLYGPAFTSIHDHWKNHSFDYTDLCWQSNVSAF